jgi:hypothetical protein
MSNINNIMNGLYGQYIDHDHQQDIANSHLCDTEPTYRYFSFEVIETRIEVTKRYKDFRIDANAMNGETLEQLVGKHMTSDEFYDFVNDNGEFIKDYAENITEDVQEITGQVWES